MFLNRILKTFLSISFTFISAVSGKGNAGLIVFKEQNAVVWFQEQVIQGTVNGPITGSLKLHCNNSLYPVFFKSGRTFKLLIKLAPGENYIWVSMSNGNSTIKSEVLKFTLGYRPIPVVLPNVIIAKNKAGLQASVKSNPYGGSLNYLWTAKEDNPAICVIKNKNSANATADIPNVAGKYFFDVKVSSGSSSATYETYLIRNKSGLHAYQMYKDHAAWIDSAVIYEINPSIFVKHGTYDAITAKLDEIRSLGINTLWLQPVYETNDSGQGYSVTDYFKLRKDYGTEQQLARMLNTAKRLHLKVIFDFVPNHTSIYHPYAKDCLEHGDSSHYYTFYQRKNDGQAYSSFYHKDKYGFFSYFWDNLVNLDFDNPEVQQWMLEAAKYWLKKFDIDGYRIDAMWGLNARSPRFIKRLATELKSIKPDLLLLAEDKPSDKLISKSGFDAAYDWTADSSWVSQWSWQKHYDARKSFTVFNSGDTLKRSALLEKAVFQNDDAAATCLRFIENNDVPRFIVTHTLEQTKMAAALIFALPGIPMLYNGQEAGCGFYPYSAKTIFTADKTIQQTDTAGLFGYYKKIVHLHLKYPALISKSISKVTLPDNPYMLAFERQEDDQRIIVIINLNAFPAIARLNLIGNKKLKEVLVGKTWFRDILTDKVFEIDERKEALIAIPMNGYGIRWLLLDHNNVTNQLIN